MKHLIEWHQNYVNALSKRSQKKHDKVLSLEDKLEHQIISLENEIEVLKESMMKISNEKIIKRGIEII